MKGALQRGNRVIADAEFWKHLPRDYCSSKHERFVILPKYGQVDILNHALISDAFRIFKAL